MIELYSQSIRLKTRDGRTLLCDVDLLQNDLRQAFAAAGIREEWPAEQFLAVVESEGTVLGQLADGGDEDAFDTLVAKLLTDAGYPEVAAEFFALKGRALPSGPVCEMRAPWDISRLNALLVRELKASAALAARLADLVAVKLTALGFAEVSDSLIVQIAEHTLGGLARAYRAVPSECAGWLMPPGYWEAFFAGPPARFVASGALKIHPVSELFPVLRITLDANAATALAATLLAPDPDRFDQVWERCCTVVAEATYTLLAETRDIITGNRRHPALINVEALDKTLADPRWRIARRQRKAVAAEAMRKLSETVKADGLDAIVSLAT